MSHHLNALLELCLVVSSHAISHYLSLYIHPSFHFKLSLYVPLIQMLYILQGSIYIFLKKKMVWLNVRRVLKLMLNVILHYFSKGVILQIVQAKWVIPTNFPSLEIQTPFYGRKEKKKKGTKKSLSRPRPPLARL